jgi:hypothetical protein
MQSSSLVVAGLEPEAQFILEQLLEQAQSALAKGATLPPVIFLLSNDMRSITPLTLNTESAESKRLSMVLASAVAREINASHSITIVEAWGVEGAVDASRSGPISEMPERLDSLFVSIESTQKQWSSWAILVPTEDRKGRRPREPVKFESFRSLQGTLCGVLTPADKGPLH